MTEQEQFDDTIKRLQDRLNAGGAEASVEKQLSELPQRPEDAPLPHDAEFLAEFSKRAPKASRPDTPAMKMWAAKKMRPGNAREGFSTGSPIVETRSPIAPEPADGAAGDEPAPVAKRSVIMPEDAGVSAPAPEESTLLAPDTSEGTDTLATFEVSPDRQAEQDDYRRRHHEASLERFIPNQPYVADTVLETPRMLQREMGPPAPPPNPQMGPPREVVMPGEGQDDSPVGVPDKLLAEPAKPTENASPAAVAQAQKVATPAVSIADTGGGDEDPEEAVKRYAANRAKGMSEILRIGNRFAAGIAGKKPDFGTADWLDKMEAGDEAAVKAAADRAQKLREYAAQRADKDRAFGLQEREVKVKERPPVVKPERPLPYGQTKEGAIDLAERKAKADAAVAAIRAAQHPSDRTESQDDRFLTQRLSKLGEVVDNQNALGNVLREAEALVPGILTGRLDPNALPGRGAQALAHAGGIGQTVNEWMGNEKANQFGQIQARIRAAIGKVDSGLVLNETEMKNLKDFLGLGLGAPPKMFVDAIQIIKKGLRQGIKNRIVTYGMTGDPRIDKYQPGEIYVRMNPSAITDTDPIFAENGGTTATAQRDVKVKVTDKNGKSKMLDPAAAEKYRGMAGFTVE